MIALCLLGGVGYFFYTKLNVTTKQEENAAQDFVNIIDIKDNFLYTKDGYIMSYFKIQPISIELLSEREKENLCNMLTAELSSINEPFKFIAISRPVDISGLLEEYTELLHNSNDHIQKELLRKEIYEMNDYVLSGEVVERQFYIVLWQKYHEDVESNLLKKTKEFIKRFDSCGINCTLLNEGEIVGLCSLVNNSIYESSGEE
jgi:type IV secretory pathway VirB4 component